MTKAQELAQFITKANYRDLDDETLNVLKRSLLDTLAVAMAATEAPPLRSLQVHINEFSPTGPSTMIGGGRCTPDLAALYNSGLIRYLDFNDCYVARGEAAHPSSTLAGVLAAMEYRGAQGRDLLIAMAVVYQVMARICDQIPGRAKGFDRTLQTAVATAAGVGKVLMLDEERLTNAIAIAATNNIALRASRTGSLSDWMHLSAATAVRSGTEAAFLAMRGISGPSEIFEGLRGLEEMMEGAFEINWREEGFDRIKRTMLRKYNADVHAQSVIEGIIELKKSERIAKTKVEKLEIEIFEVAERYISGGNGDDRSNVMNREEAAHSLPFLASAALLDGEVGPKQYRHRRIRQRDMRKMTDRVEVRAAEDLTERFPEELCCRILITMKDGTTYETEKSDYAGFYTRPMSWEDVSAKFVELTEDDVKEQVRDEITERVQNIERERIDELTPLLKRVTPS